MAKELVNPDGSKWIPEFEGQRPPFQPGNTLSLKHGVDSPSRVDPLADRYKAEILSNASMTYLTEPQYAAVFWRYCRACARVQLIEDWVDSMDMSDAARSDRGQTSALELLRKWTATMLTLAGRLGLDPLSYARLGKDIVATRVDLASLLSQRDDTPQRPDATTPTPP